MTRPTWIGVLALFALGVCSTHAHAQFGNLFRRGPSVDVISTPRLASMLNQQKELARKARESGNEPAPADFVLVDVRSDKEVNVSVIPGAITKSHYEKNREEYRGRTVIAYCTVGVRSDAYARQLAKDGIKAKNYKGSILDWVKHQLPLATLDGKPTKRVHTYSDDYPAPKGYEQVTD